MLRCLAFLLVFLHHGEPLREGWPEDLRLAGAFGVCVFFFLSAFLITELLTREQDATGTADLSAFYVRRVLRIWPLYFAALFFDFAHLHFTHPGLFTGTRLAAFLLLAGNWYVMHHAFVGSLSLPLWSISVEEQFYVVWPRLQRDLSRGVALVCCGLTIAAAYLALARACHSGTDLDTGIWVNSLVQFQFFATGAATSLLLKGRAARLSMASRFILCATGLTALYLAQARFHAKLGPTPAHFASAAVGYLFINIGCIILFFAFLGASELIRAKPLLYLGRISYGLYVFHFAMLSLCEKGLQRLPQARTPLMLCFKETLALLLTIALASLSWKFFESPILGLKRRFEIVRTRTA